MTTVSSGVKFFDSIGPELRDALASLAEGGLAVVIDSSRDRADLVAVARTMTPEAVNVMITHGRGVVSVAITGEQRARLALPAMPGSSTLASVEASSGVGTGISAADRALTIRTLADAAATPDDVVCPGHIVPIVAAAGGLLSHVSRVEAAIDIARLADSPGAAICEVLDEESGDLSTTSEARALADRIGVPATTVAAVIEARIEIAVTDW